MPTLPIRLRFIAFALPMLLMTGRLLIAQPIVDIQVHFVRTGNPYFNDDALRFDLPPEQQVRIEAQIVFVRMGTVPGFGISGDFGSKEIVRLDSIGADPPGTLLCDIDPASTFFGCSGGTFDPPDTMHAVFNVTGVGLGTVMANIDAFAVGDPDTTNNADTTTVVVGEESNLARISGAVYLDPIGYKTNPLDVIEAGTTRPMTGVVIDLLDESGTIVKRDTTTNGAYSFDVQPGMYQVRQHVPDGTYRVFPFNPDVHLVSAEAGVHTFNVDFLNTPFFKVTGRKLHDIDRNLLVNDPNDVGLNGWTIRIAGHTMLGEPFNLETTTADIDVDGDGIPDQGGYEFRVPPGEYEVDEVVQSGFERTRRSHSVGSEGPDTPPILIGPRIILFLFDKDTDDRPWKEDAPDPRPLLDWTKRDFINWSIRTENINVSPGGAELDQAIRGCNESPEEEPCDIDIEEVIMKNGSGQYGVITLQNPLPTITAPMIIDGRGATLDGSLLDGADGLAVSGVGAVIRNFTITNFDGHGIRVDDGGRVKVDSASITNNGGAGVRVAEGASVNVEATSIFGNTGVAIDLGDEGPTPNNGNDDDGIPGAPAITSVEAGDTLFVYVSYQGRDTSSVTFQVFTSSACGPDGTGQGEFLMGGFETETDSVGSIDMVLAVDTTFVPKRYVSLTATNADGNTSEFSACDESVVTGVDDEFSDREEARPSALHLQGTYPNPFNDWASIEFDVEEAQSVRIDIVDVLGRVVVAATEEMRAAGRHTVQLRTEHLPAGVYFARIAAGDVEVTQKITRVR